MSVSIATQYERVFSYFKKYVYKTFNKIYKSKYSTGSKSLKYKPNKYFNQIFNL